MVWIFLIHMKEPSVAVKYRGVSISLKQCEKRGGCHYGLEATGSFTEGRGALLTPHGVRSGIE